MRGSRNVGILAASLFALSAGEELWQAYVPAYLTALGAGGLAVGAFGSAKDLLDSLYQYPGGWLSDRLGRRRALLVFTATATAGYLIYATAPSWPLMFAGLIAVMAWKAAAFPTTFAVVGDALPRERRSTAFAVQSVLVRVPRVVSAPIGGAVIAALGIVAGARLCFAITVAVGVVVLALQHWFFDAVPRAAPPDGRTEAGIPPALRQLLVADSLVRIGEGLAASFIVLFVTQVSGVPVARYGTFYAVQQAVAILGYLPGARIAGALGRPPLVAATFFFFAAFPLAVRWASTDTALLFAFVLGGLKELGEPARKSLIVDLAPQDRVASTVGTYYAIRNFLVVPAGLVGGLLWQVRPQLPLEIAAVVSTVGMLVFILTAARAGGRAARS